MPQGALAQMEVAFIGYPSQREIQQALDAAFAATDTPVTEENTAAPGACW